LAVDGFRLAAALVPVAVVLVLMAGAQWGAARAGPVGWLSAVLVATVAFESGGQLIWVSQARGLLLSAYVLYIIWTALGLFHLVDEAGALPVIATGVARATTNRLLQLLLIAWAFASFLQGVTGFGVPVAVVTPLLVGLGFSPLVSVVAASIGHAWAVTFGSIASSFYAMLAVTGLSGNDLAPASAALLGAACLACGGVVAWLHDGPRGVMAAWRPLLAIGGVMALTQWLLAYAGLWGLAAFTSGLAGMAAGALMARAEAGRSRQPAAAAGGTSAQVSSRSLGVAVSAYAVLFGIVVAAETVPPLADWLNRLELAPTFPATSTGLGWHNPVAAGRSLSPFGHPGALIAYSALIAYWIYRRAGWLHPGAAGRIVRRTGRSAAQATIGVSSLVGMATLMGDAGMTYALASWLASAAGAGLPLIAPLIGALGAFLTGSNTNSNVLFAPLQLHAATMSGVSVPVIMAAQNAGGAIGSAFAPAKIVVGCSTAGLAGQEGQVLRATLRYGLVVLIITGLLATVAAALG
jgi:lactate permease